MSDQFDDELTDEEGVSFADLLDEYSADAKDNLNVGDKIKGKIISIGKDAVFVDTGTKIDGSVERKELLDENGNLPYAVGDILELYVMTMDESEVVLSKALSGVGGIHMLKDAFQNAIPVEGKVTGPCNGGFNVEVLKRRAFCPISQMDVKFVEKQDEYVGQTYEFVIIQFEENGRNIVVSRRKILEAELEKQREAFLKDVKEGSTVDGKITKLMPYGAFVELIPGVEGMIHISELSWAKVQKPEDILTRGQKVKVAVLEIKPQNGGKKPPKIGLSMKQLSEDPWDTITDKFKTGEKVTGKVTRCMPFGAFVEIEPGIEGLVHISEMSYTRRVLKVEDVVKPKDVVSVLIKEIDPKSRRISLSIKEIEGDPWADIEGRYAVGQTVSGKVEQKVDFGLFVQLTPGVTGLLPKSNFNKAGDPKIIDGFKPGDAIEVVVDAIDTDGRKISLSPVASAGETQWKEYATEDQGAMGLLAEKLQSALNKKKD